MSQIVLKFPPALKAHAIKCSSVGSLLKLTISLEEDGDLKHLTVSTGSGKVTGSSAICKYFMEVQPKAVPRNAFSEAKLLQWMSFADSELSHSPPGVIRHLGKSLDYLDTVLEKSKFLRCVPSSVGPIIS